MQHLIRNVCLSRSHFASDAHLATTMPGLSYFFNVVFFFMSFTHILFFLSLWFILYFCLFWQFPPPFMVALWALILKPRNHLLYVFPRMLDFMSVVRQAGHHFRLFYELSGGEIVLAFLKHEMTLQVHSLSARYEEKWEEKCSKAENVMKCRIWQLMSWTVISTY